MSALEDRLRDAFRADAGTVRPETIPDLPERATRRRPRQARSRLGRVLIPLTAAAAVGAVVAGLSLASPLLRGHGHAGQATSASSPSPGHPATGLPTAPPTSPKVIGPVPLPTLGPDASRGVPASATPSGAPHFYVTVWVALGGTASLVVRDTATGKIAARLNPPPGAVFSAIAAPAGDRTFVTAIMGTSACTSQLYEFQLNRQGQPGPLVPLHITVPGNYIENGDLAITADGGTIAYNTYLCARGVGEVGVINLATRHVRVWTWTAPTTFITDLSLSADGTLLAYDTLPGARILNTDAPAGPVLQRSRIVSRTAGWAAFGPDDTSLYTCAVSPGGQAGAQRGTLTYSTDSLATGQQQVIASWAGLPYPQCGASLDPSGRYLLVQYPVSVPNASDWVRPAILDVRSGLLTGINAPAYYGPLDVAW